MNRSMPKRIGSYEIVRVIGRGGMGVVYLGRDSKLEREVALKCLPEEFQQDPKRLSRFEREAKALASLNHPHIATIHGLEEVEGQQFIVMEYVDGLSLKDVLAKGGQPWRAKVEIAAAVAEALAAAHARGVVHRDIKPDNLRITRDGTVKLLDFGLASTVPEDDRAANDGTTLVCDTEPGQAMGTPGYMSPEQVRGESADLRSDVFSFGCVLHEMLTGHQTFVRETKADSMAATLMDTPAGPAQSGAKIPPELDTIVMRCLQKRPADRYQSTDDLAFALRSTLQPGSGSQPAQPVKTRRFLLWIGAPILLLLAIATIPYLNRPGDRPDAGPEAPAPITSLAVLPFANVSDDPDAAFLCEGIAESIINRMGGIGELRVKSRNASFRHAGREDELADVARELGVGAILTGWVTRRDDDLTISVALQNQLGDQIWGERFERSLASILDLERDIANRIALELSLTLTDQDRSRVEGDPTENTKAYVAYIQGQGFQSRIEAGAYENAERFYDEAIRIDPQFARAYAGKALLYCNRGIGLHSPADEIKGKAIEAAEAATRLNPELPEAHLALGFIYWLWEWNFEEAKREMNHSIQLNRGDFAYGYHLLAHVLSSQGRYGEALEASRKAVELEPTVPIFNSCHGHFLAWNGQLVEALKKMKDTIARDPSFGHARVYYNRELVAQKRAADAVKELEALSESLLHVFRVGDAIGDLAWTYGKAGQVERANAELQALSDREASGEYIPHIAFARAYAGLDNREKTLESLHAAVKAHEAVLPLIRNEPHFRHLHEDEEFLRILDQIGIPR